MARRSRIQSNQGRKYILLIIILLVVAAGALFLLKRSEGGLNTGQTSTEIGDTSRLATQDEPSDPKEDSANQTAYSKLLGRWLREDGGYVLEVSEAGPDGRLEAAYFNPRPIHVSNAAAVTEGRTIKVGIELNDVNYPGCLYTLVFDPALDQLVGTYFQAAIGQVYQVVFVRVPAD